MQVNSIHSNQTFGAISFTPYAEKVVKGRIKTKSGLKDFYQTRSEKEAQQMVQLLKDIYKVNKGEENGTK